MKHAELTKKDSELLTKNLFFLSNLYLGNDQVHLLKLASSCYQNALTVEVAKEAHRFVSKLCVSMPYVENDILDTQEIISVFEETIRLFDKYGKS